MKIVMNHILWNQISDISTNIVQKPTICEKRLSSPKICRLRTVAKTTFLGRRRQKMHFFCCLRPKNIVFATEKPRKNIGKTCITMTELWLMTQIAPEGKNRLAHKIFRFPCTDGFWTRLWLKVSTRYREKYWYHHKTIQNDSIFI